jgi:hypothetical protein
MIDREALLDELARCFVQAAVTRLLRERRTIDDGSPDRCLSREKSDEGQPVPASAGTARLARPGAAGTST